MKQLEHTKIINRIAKNTLSPHGIIRKGQSRTWHDDHGWYTTIIDFEPSGFDRGTYLTIGINFHWHLQDFFSYDIVHEKREWIQFISEGQFSIEVEKLASMALDRALDFRKELSTLEIAKEFIISNTSKESIWGDYHCGVICGLLNDQPELAKYFNCILKDDDDFNWTRNLKKEVQGLIKSSDSLDDFKRIITEIIYSSRKLKKLPEVKINL